MLLHTPYQFWRFRNQTKQTVPSDFFAKETPPKIDPKDKGGKPQTLSGIPSRKNKNKELGEDDFGILYWFFSSRGGGEKRNRSLFISRRSISADVTDFPPCQQSPPPPSLQFTSNTLKNRLSMKLASIRNVHFHLGLPFKEQNGISSEIGSRPNIKCYDSQHNYKIVV